jgi:hypothetical protein
MRKTLLVLWAAFCLISVVIDIGALAEYPKVYYLWACLALDAGTVPLCAWLYSRPPLRAWLHEHAERP